MAHTPTIATPKEADPVKPAADPRARWTSWVAVTTAILAALASITSLLSGYHTDEAMIEQIQVADEWNFYQAKGIKRAVLESKLELLPVLGKDPAAAERADAARYSAEQEEILAKAQTLEKSADDHRRRRAILARAVTGYQIGIALCAIALLTKKEWFWGLALLAAAAATVFFVQGLLPSAGPTRLKAPAAPPPAGPAVPPAPQGS
jgi:hypothetical protein